jgi:predicted RNA-binding Zn-ribbon protein involved in translation (DUF1610 family)
MMPGDASIFSGMAVPQLQPTKELSEQEFQEEIFPILQGILDRTFPSVPEKRFIKRQASSWAFACPFCGDSYGDPRKKRGGFIFKPGEFYHLFKCHNCGKAMSIKNFFKHFKTDISGDATEFLDTHKAIPGTRTYGNFDATVTSSLFNNELIDRLSVTKDYLIQRFGLLPVSEDNRNQGYYYLKGRCQWDMGHFLYDPRSNSILILNRTPDDKVVGFQIRYIEKKQFITVDLKRIHEEIVRDNADVPTDYNTLSMLFNIFRVNLAKPVMATEGPLDAFLLPNAIAILGASKHVPLEIPLYWFFDYDKAGNKEADEHLAMGHYVFQWEKLIKDYGLPKQEYVNGLVGGKPRKWDVTDFFKWCRDNKVSLPRYWKPYFSNDIKDIDPLSL